MRRIYDKYSGYAIRVNLYIIRFIYYHIEKDSCFILDEALTGKKKKVSASLYAEDYFLSRQRMSRINHGERFEFSENAAQKMRDLFGISKHYFLKEANEPFKIKGIKKLDWACFYKTQFYLEDEEASKLSEDEILERYKKVKDALHRLVETWENSLTSDDPLYLICFYYHYGEPYDKSLRHIEYLKELLQNIRYEEWEKENRESIEQAYQLLERHYRYLQYKLGTIRLKEAEKTRLK